MGKKKGAKAQKIEKPQEQEGTRALKTERPQERKGAQEQTAEKPQGQKGAQEQTAEKPQGQESARTQKTERQQEQKDVRTAQERQGAQTKRAERPQGKTGAQAAGAKERARLLHGNYALLPILFVMCVIPFIMRLYLYDSGLEQYPWFPPRNQEADIFLHYRGIALMAAAAVMAVVFAYAFYKEWKGRRAFGAQRPRGSGKARPRGGEGKREDGKGARGMRGHSAIFAGTRLAGASWLLPLAAFWLLAFVSTLLSPNRSYGFHGIYSHFEPIWVVLSYCAVAIFTFYFVRTRKDVDTMQKGLFFLLVVMGLIGASQFSGHDIWETDLGKGLYVPAEYASLKDSLSFNFSDSSTNKVYLTLYNPNYVGVFAALVVPISAMLCVGSQKWWKKAAWGAVSALTFLCALGSGSKAFMISLVATAVLGMVLYGRRMARNIPIMLMYGLTALYVGSVFMNYENVDLKQYLKNALTPVENVYPVEDFSVGKEDVTLRINGMDFHMLCEGMNETFLFKAWDEAGTDVPYTIDENSVVHFADERFAGITVSLYFGYDRFDSVAVINAAGHQYGFAKDGDAYTYMNAYYRPDEMVRAESAIFTDHDRLFTGRGYIWSRSIPLLKRHLLLGSGADTFILEFPQNDYVARTNAGYQNQILTKPHSLYLQMGVQYGVVALLCYLALGVLYVAQTLRLCWRADFRSKESCLALGILMGICGYGIMGISNDSCVALTPLAWLILGLGFSVNCIVRESIREADAAQEGEAAAMDA